MKFPVSNKEEAYTKVFAVLLVMVCAAYIFYSILNEFVVFYVLGFFVVYALLASISFVRKQNVKSLTLDQDMLIVDYRGKVIEISISNIKKIYSGIGGLNLKLDMSKRYVIVLKSEYPFGTKLRVTYRDSNPEKQFFEEDPIEIKTLKQKIEKLGK